MIDMKIEPAAKTMLGEATAVVEPDYPYGLRITLDDAVLAKLGVGKLPEIGTEFKLQALAYVVSVSARETSSGRERDRSVELQIKALELAPATEKGGDAQRIYPNSEMNP